MWGAGKRAAQQSVDAYFKKLSSSEIPRDDEMAQCYAAKIALDTVKDSEARVRSIQTLANMHHPACILPLVRELMSRATRWPHAGRNVDMEAVSTLLLESLVRYSGTLANQAPDAPIEPSTS
jgi:hypothetical protein